MTATQRDRRMTRRGVMRATAVGIGAAAGMGALGSTATPAAAIDWNDAGTIAASFVVGGPIGLAWAIRESDALGSNAPPTGLTAGSLRQNVYSTIRTRDSTIRSTMVDNQNLVEGAKNIAYTDGKIAAIEALNNGVDKATVKDAATSASNDHFATIQTNFARSLGEMYSELETLQSTVNSHSDVTFGNLVINQGWPDAGFAAAADSLTELHFVDYSVTLANGNSVTVRKIDEATSSTEGTKPMYSGFETEEYGQYVMNLDWFTNVADYDTLQPPESTDLNDVWTSLTTAASDVESGLGTWVDSVYQDVQAGEIEISDLITPRERAAMFSEEETQAQAIADLAALNIPVDSEREATVTISETGATLSGTIGLTDSSDGPIESGTTYDPSTFAGDVYLTADVSQITGTWDAYQSGVDGGTITLTAEPYEGTVLDVTTTAGETVSIPASDWTDNGDGTYSYDATSGLETTITEVDSVAYASESSETQYETIELSRSFTVDKLTNRQTGEEETSASFESSEPQDDTNYITQEEWEQLEQQNRELIKKYEESKDGGGGGGGGLPEDQNWGLIAIGAGALAVGWGYVTGDEE